MLKRERVLLSVEERVSRLERENRKLKVFAISSFVLVVVGFSMGLAAQSGSYRYIEANTFVLKDSGGHIRGQWTTQGTSSGFTLNDDHEQPVMELLNSPEYHATKFSLIGPKGVVSLWATNDEASLIVKESNYPQVPNRAFLGIRNSPAFSLLTLNNGAGMNKVVLHASDGGGFGIILDEKDVPVWAAVKNKPDIK